MELRKRKSPRITDYDYSTPNYYFITICTYDKKCIFGYPEKLNALGKIAEEHILQISSHYDGVIIDKYVVMPNHIHMIVVLSESNQNNLNQVIAQYKSGVSRDIRKIDSEASVWQRSYHDHIIRNQKGYEKIWEYIENNPLKWEEDCFYIKER